MSRANSHQLMTTEDRDLLTGMLELGVSTQDKRQFAIRTLEELRDAEENGDDGAGRIISAMAYDGIFRALDKQAKRETGVFKDSKTGRVLNFPKVGSIAVNAPDGSATGARQLKYWEEMTRAEFSVWFESQKHLSESLRFKVRGFQRVMRAWEQFPDAVNAYDVCIAAGIDPDEIDVAA